MESRNVHTNCVKVQFGPRTKMPTDKEVFAFFRKREWLPESLCAMFREPREYSVYVKFQSEELMKAALLKCPPSDTFAYDNGETVQVSFATARGDFRYVRLFGLPVEVDDKHVATVLSKYGKIHHMVRERFGPDTGYPILNGVRGAHMEISTAIPPQLHVQHFQVRVFYEGMQNKCFACGSPEHVKANCPKRTSVSNRLTQNGSGSTSYAGALMGLAINQNTSTVEGPVTSAEGVEAKSQVEGVNAAMVAELPTLAAPTTVSNKATTDEAGSASQQETSNSITQVPVPAARTCLGKMTTTDNEKERPIDDQEWSTAKKRGRTSRKDGTAEKNGSDSSDPETPKLRLLEKQSERTRSRSQRKKSK